LGISGNAWAIAEKAYCFSDDRDGGSGGGSPFRACEKLAPVTGGIKVR